MVEFFVAYGWIFWLGLILLFLTIEMFTLDFTFLMIGIGSVGGLLSSLVGAPWFVQVLLAAVVSTLLIFTLRPPLLRRLRRNADPVQSNIAALIGLGGAVVAAMSLDGGQVKLVNGETWTAKLSPTIEAQELGLGERVVVVEIEGATALVVPEERTTQ
ncbi:NfeD family protein [Alpinimonas psychrophila]|uniref:Membrane protein implicated in regulation of membrane protease activity n=1 Tax=Alpinimonas psychrophila TaxID=748908 RepID=A0A7W3JSE9_9MICO|nr:NfeD family protein [Alpinimonas psychrophila]MBA8828388.1 membrane protein implicated in regulation of membrane protease activity [Alpinimonas psychrophila]